MNRYNCYDGESPEPQFDDNACKRYPQNDHSCPDTGYGCCCNGPAGPQGPIGDHPDRITKVRLAA